MMARLQSAAESRPETSLWVANALLGLHDACAGCQLHFEQSAPELALQVPRQCPRELVNLIHDCMKQRPEDRPTAKAIFDLLKVHAKARVGARVRTRARARA